MRNFPRNWPERPWLVQPPFREKPTSTIKVTEPVKPDPRYEDLIRSVFEEAA